VDEQELDNYADSLFGGEDQLLQQMRDEAETLGIPSIQVPSDLARLLTVLIGAIQPKRVLEIGTLFGYSSIVMARALPGGATITTLEVSLKHAEVARRNFDRAGVTDRINLREGSALDTLKTLHGEQFDFVFIDADKPSYPAYLDAVLNLSHSGTVIVADNVWRNGGVLTLEDDGTQALATFNGKVAENERLLSTIVSTRDGSDAAMISVVR
jgi:predicted O-methyltransferase YrrM